MCERVQIRFAAELTNPRPTRQNHIEARGFSARHSRARPGTIGSRAGLLRRIDPDVYLFPMSHSSIRIPTIWRRWLRSLRLGNKRSRDRRKPDSRSFPIGTTEQTVR